MVSNLFPPHSVGGHERLCARTARRWAGGHDVAVLTRSAGAPAVETDGGLRVLRLLPPQPAVRTRGGRLVDARWSVATARAVRRALGDEQPDLVVAYGTHGIAHGALARLFAMPTTAVIADYSLLDRLAARETRAVGIPRRAYAATLRAATEWTGRWDPLPLPRRWVFVSDAIRRTYEERLGGLDAVVVHNGVEVPAVRPPLAPRGPRLRVGALARLVPEKGLHTLVAAGRLLAETDPEHAPDIEIRGPAVDAAYAVDLARAAAEAAEHGAAVRVGGPLAEGDVASWMATKDCIALPSAWGEPFALVPLEAMAAGRPVVGTRCGGSAEILEDGVTALVHEPDDAAGLAAALGRLAGDPAIAERIAAAAFDLVSDRFRSDLADTNLDAAVLGATGG